jgi:hypothetical protein
MERLCIIYDFKCFEREIQESIQQKIIEEDVWHTMMNNMYNYTDDGFCDGFTKW